MFDKMNDAAIAQELGRRVERIRLEQDITQQELAAEVGMTAKTYRQLINGGGKFVNLIAVLRVLNALPALDSFIPERNFSPLQLLELKGRQRKRASGNGHFEAQQVVEPDANTDMDW